MKNKDIWGYGSDLENQCIKLFNENADTIGESRREAKDKAIASGAKGFSEIAEQTGVSSFGTSNTYVSIWKELAKFAEEEKGIKNICDISNKTVKQYLHRKMNEDHNIDLIFIFTTILISPFCLGWRRRFFSSSFVFSFVVSNITRRGLLYHFKLLELGRTIRSC